MKKLILALVSACALGFSAVAADWFNGGIAEGWPTASTLSGGAWANGGAGGTFEDGAVTVDATADAPLTFTAAVAKVTADYTAAINSTVSFTAFETLPSVPADAKAGVISYDGNFYVLAADENGANVWTDSEITASETAAVTFTFKDATTVEYNLGGSTVEKTVDEATSVQNFCATGDGTITALTATAEEKKVSFTVTAIENATYKVEGEGVEEVEGDTWKAKPDAAITVTYTADAGYLFSDGTTTQVVVGKATKGGTITPAETEVKKGAAKIGTTYYLTLQEALNVGGDVVMLADVTSTVSIPVGKTVALDFNGFKITTTSGSAIKNYGTLTVANGNITAQEMAFVLYGNSVTTISGGTYTTVDNAVIGGNGLVANSNVVLTVTGGTFNGGITTAGYIACGVYVANSGTWDINGGTWNINGGVGILSRAGTVGVKGATFNVTAPAAAGWVGDSKVAIDGAVVAFDNISSYPGYKATDKIQIDAITIADGGISNVGIYGEATIVNNSTTSLTAPAGYLWKDGVLTKATAKIGDVYYLTLADAFSHAVANDTITLCANVSALDATITTSLEGLKLDMNGFSITADKRVFVVAAGSFEITGTGSITASVSPDSSSVIRVGSDNDAAFTLGANVTVTAPVSYGITYFGKGAQTVTINGTVIAEGEASALSGNGSATMGKVTLVVNGTATATKCVAIYNPQSGTTTINGTVNGGIETKAGTLTVQDSAKVSALTGVTPTHKTNNNGPSTIGYAVAVVNNAGYKQPATAALKDGPTNTPTITGKVGIFTDGDAKETGTLKKDAAITAEAIDGYCWDTDGNLVKAAAKIGDVYYITLADAATAATTGQTITLLADASGAAIFVTKTQDNLTFDFGGYTYTVTGPAVGSKGTESQGFHIEAANCTLTNGTLTSSAVAESNVKMLVQNYSNLTLADITLDGRNISESGKTCYVLSDNNGATTLGKGVVINANTGDFAFDVCRYSSYPSVSVTVDGAKINGNIEVSASKGDIKDGCTLTLMSGSVTGDLVMDASATNAVVKKISTFTLNTPEGYEWKGDGSTQYETLTKKSDTPAVPEQQGAIAPVPGEENTYAVSNTTDTVTIENLPANSTVILDPSVTHISGMAEETTIKIVAESTNTTEKVVDITSAFTVTPGTGTSASIALNPDASVTIVSASETETIPVTPVFSKTTDTVKPLVISDTTVGVGVKTIPGLTYQIMKATEVGGTYTPYGTPITAKGTRVALEAAKDADPSAFYKVQVTK